MLTIAAAYILSGLLIWAVESARMRGYGPDFYYIYFDIGDTSRIAKRSVCNDKRIVLYCVVDMGVPFFNKVLNGVGYDS